MKNNILKALTNNLGFKILALFFAFTLWLFVYNLDDPTKSKTLMVNVTLENRESIENMGKYYEILEGSNKVAFSVTAARSILDKLDESDFVATADMEQIVIEESGDRAIVPIDIVCTSNINQNAIKLSSTNKNLKVSLEDLMIKQFVVSASAIGKVADGYALGSLAVTAPNVLKVSGPKSIVERITSAVATIDVSGMSDPRTTYKVKPVLYDKDGKEIDETRLTKSDHTVTVSAEILSVKEVAIAVKTTGSPKNGHVVTAISSNPTTILLKGNKALLNSVNSIEIPEELVSVEGADKDVKITIDVSEYIPDGVSMLDAEKSNVEITVSIAKVKEKVFSISSENIIVTGLPTHYELEFALSSYAAHIFGLEEDIASLSGTNLSGNIDVTDLSAGIHEVDLVLDLDDSKYSHLPLKVGVSIIDTTVPEVNESEQPDQSEEPEEPDNSSDLEG